MKKISWVIMGCAGLMLQHSAFSFTQIPSPAATLTPEHFKPNIPVPARTETPNPHLSPIPLPTFYPVGTGAPYKTLTGKGWLYSRPWTAYNKGYLPQGKGPPALPLPAKSSIPALTLTLQDAILLALRDNQDVKTADLQRVVDKFALMLAHNQFEPQFSFETTGTFANRTDPAFSVNPTVTLTTPLGTQASVSYTNDLDGTENATVTVTQPLLKGFGYVNKIPYLDALDAEEVAKMTYKSSIITAVIDVIQAYRTLVEDYNNVKINKETLKETEETVREYKLQVKAGKMAESDLIQQEATLATTRLSYVQAQNTLITDYQDFLSALGVIPGAHLKIVEKIQTKPYKLPSLKKSIRIALKNNISYQSALFSLRSTRRAIFTAEDARKVQFDLTASRTIGGGTTTVLPSTSVTTVGGATIISGTPTLASGNQSLMFTLNVPINDVSDRAALIDAKVAYQQGVLSLQKQKEDLIREVMSDYSSLKNQYEQIQIGKEAVKLQAQNLANARLKYKHGLSTAFEVTQIQDELLTQETSQVSTEIGYLNGIASFNELLGITLDKWHINLRY